MTRSLLSLVCLLGVALPSLALAQGPAPAAGSLAAEPARPQIAYGELAEPCAWPTVVSVEGASQCTGTLIHPRVVLYAAHCGGGTKTLRFGEDSLAGGRAVMSADCIANPDYGGAQDQGRDWAYCLLPEAIELPVTPPLYGCEGLALEVGSEVAIAGFGETEQGELGQKRWALTTLAALTPANNTALVGGMMDGTPTLCSGDSGGPAFLRMEDGSWRTMGVASTSVGECGGYGAYSLVPAAAIWIEADADIELTPCFTSDGSWAPGPDCAGANAAAPGVGAGSWDDWCSGTASAGASTTCGPAWDAFDSSLPPSVAIVAPVEGEIVELGITDVEVSASKDPAGYAVAQVRLELDGVPVGEPDLRDPWTFELPLVDRGQYDLVAIAEDWAGNEVRSATLTIIAGSEDGPGESGADESDEDGAEGSGGCACVSAPQERPARGGLLLGLYVLCAVAVRDKRRRNLR